MKIDEPTAKTYHPFMSSSGASSATEEVGSIPVAAAEVAATESKETARSFLQSARRNLSDEELATPAARRFLIADLERMDQICAELENYRDQYHDQRVLIATLTETQKMSRRVEILSFICLSVGSAGLGAAPGYVTLKDGLAIGIVIMALAAVLVISGVVTRFFK